MMIEDESDRSFVASLYQKYEKRMKAVAFDILKNDHDAEDCVHDTVITIVNKLEAFKKTNGEQHLKWLVLLVCKNTALNMRKKSLRKQSTEIPMTVLASDSEVCDDLPDSAPTPEEIAVEEDTVKLMISMINRLDKKYSDVILLKYSGFNNKDISLILSISQDSVRQRIFKAKNQLLKMGGGIFNE